MFQMFTHVSGGTDHLQEPLIGNVNVTLKIKGVQLKHVKGYILLSLNSGIFQNMFFFNASQLSYALISSVQLSQFAAL